VRMGEEDEALEVDGLQMVSMGWTNPTPWHTFREAEEPELAERIERVVTNVTDPDTAIFNFHAPPYASKLDNAPAINEATMQYVAGGQAIRPVGSTSVRESIQRIQPLLSLHGHIHESKGAARIGRTLALNPGSSYEEGVLQGAIVDIDPKKRKIKNYQLVNG
jgi:uncharacterized protein